MKRHTATYIANFYIDMARYDENETITNLRVNKLLYYAQAWSLVQNKEPLFDDDFEAWDYGPVVPSVYQKYRCFKKDNIDVLDSDYSVDGLSENDLRVLLASYNYFNQFSTTSLVNATHEKDSPWFDAYNRGQSTMITKESITDWFTIPDVVTYHVTCRRGSKSGRWTAIGDDIPGLIAEEDTFNELQKECYLCANELIELNDMSRRPFVIEFSKGPELEDD